MKRYPFPLPTIFLAILLSMSANASAQSLTSSTLRARAIMENSANYMQLAIIHVLPGKEDEFEAIFTRRRVHVLALEPDALVYDMYKSTSEPRTYIVHEYFTSKEAEVAHLKIAIAHPEYETQELIACFDGRPILHVLTPVAVAK